MGNRLHERQICERIRKFIEIRRQENFSETIWLDDIEVPGQKVEVICSGPKGKLVIEHTLIESFPGQIEDGIHSFELLSPVKKSLSGKLPGPGHCHLAIKCGAVTGIKNVDTIRENIKKWIILKANNLKIGSFIREIPEGVPFEVSLYRRPKKDGNLEVGRFEPEKIEEKRRQRIRIALDNKCPKLGTAKDRENALSVLVFESDDIESANPIVITDAVMDEIANIEKTIPIPDYIFLVVTESEPWLLWVLKENDILYSNDVDPVPYELES